MAIEVKDLAVNFGGNRALTDVNLVVHVGDTVSVIGPNGAGKTTLLNAIGGLIPSGGEIRIVGQDASRLRSAQIANLGVSRSFQDPPLLDRETVLDNVLLGAHRSMQYRMLDQVVRRRRVRRFEDFYREKALSLIDQVGLSRYAHASAGTLPFGARKLVDIVRAMVSDPVVLLLDEPSSGIDASERETLATILRDLNSGRNLATLVVEHHMDLVRAISTHVLALQVGKVFMHGSPADVLDSQTFREALVGGHTDESGDPPPSTPVITQGGTRD